MTRDGNCPRCGTKLEAASSPEGLCPPCLMQQALEEFPSTDGDGDDSTRDSGKVRERLLDRHLNDVFNLAFRMLGERGGAGEVTRAVFLEVCCESGEIDLPRFRNRLYRLTIRESIARLEDGSRVSKTCESPEAVAQALLTLSPESRAVILLRHVCGCGYLEIGRILRVSEKTVKRRLFDARRRLLEPRVLEPRRRTAADVRIPGKRASGSGP